MIDQNKLYPGEARIMNTEITDRTHIYRLFEEAIIYQRINNVPVWNGYNKALIDTEIHERTQYKIVIDNQIAGIFSVCKPGALEAELWKEKVSEKSIYLNRIVTDRIFRGKRLFKTILDWIDDFTSGSNFKHIRMDTWADNPFLVDYYKTFGFHDRGIINTSESEALPPQYRKLTLLILEKNLNN
jgi:GNAT superfamily N-acetyltransferase